MRSHAADGLHHGRLPIVRLFVEEAIPKAGFEQGVQRERRAEDAGVFSRAGKLREAGAFGADVLAGLVERAVGVEEVEHPRGVFGGHLVVERATADALGEEFGDVAAGVVAGLALDDRFAAVGLVVLQECTARAVDLNLQPHTQLAAVVEHSLVRGGQATGTEVLIAILIPGAGLRGAVGEDDLVAAAHGPVASAGATASFEQDAAIAECLQFVRGDEAGDASAENHD